MTMINIHSTSLENVLIIEPRVFRDDRGFFLETYHQKKYQAAGLDCTFVQDNHSHSIQGVLRGLHYQLDHPQGKLVFVLKGAIFDVAVDIRPGSPSYRKWIGLQLSEENHRQVFIPPGFAHGFCVLSEQADVIYKCTDLYYPEDDRGLRWDDPALAIQWPIRQPLLSAKDAGLPLLADLPTESLPKYNF